ncbi:diguanylate cyclase (GGDEF) domain-containing protein [Noviherbaspirillum humi]|uniref:diguanylate cyclase n=1 Tax=Noviherbaspirillum humi TaxID=1688639 RepID=A0A239JUK7_9BURK|nr:GGDEF domain-containing protein [Noviherbaspirillum humi]SNT09389.1 diguanylate cyclase (GGDEF) domain-containing protein [Noviherbaspirillum humi]
MDAKTAAFSLVLVQLCVAVTMTGAFYATRDERCTKYWATSGVLTGIGILFVLLNGGASNYLLLTLGNSAFVAGMVTQWWGIQAFYGSPRSRFGWSILAAFVIAYALVLFNGASIIYRNALFSATAGWIYLLCLMAIWRQRYGSVSFGRTLTLGALALLVAAMAARLTGVAFGLQEFVVSPAKTSGLGVIVVYFAPLIGLLLFSSGLLMLYFEKLVHIKHHLATHDELTELLNRRALVAGGERELELAGRTGQPLAVAYLDIDHFKKINDSLGHENGDSVLVEMARVLKEACRGTDLVGRYGGEEFCMVLPGIDHEGAEAFGKRLLEAIRNHRFPSQTRVTASIGFAIHTGAQPFQTWTQMMGQADKALYEAKDGGRDQLRIAPDLGSMGSNRLKRVK